MDNLTHSFVGLALAKSGLEKWSPGITSLCVLAANAPDSDIVVLLFSDRWGFLQHHRGITHSIVGTLALALILPLLFYAGDLLISKLRRRPRQVNLSGLFAASLIVSFTHPLMDWTNNYGIRFLLPWNSKWFYGDLVFIVDPFMWLVLGGACFLLTSETRFQRVAWSVVGLVLTLLIVASPRAANLPYPWVISTVWITLLGLLIVAFVNRVGEHYGAKVTLTSFALVLVYWGILGFAHSIALARAEIEAKRLAAADESISRLAAMPTLVNPFGWDCVFETNKATYRFSLNLRTNATSRTARYEKPEGKLKTALDQISPDRPTQIFLGFARFPVAQLADPSCTSQTLVQLADLRYTQPGSSRGTFSLELPVDCSETLTDNR